jgi:hypothetical protein
MKFPSISLCILLAGSPLFGAKNAVIPMKYEGGSLALDQHDGLKVTILGDSISISQDDKRFSIPAKAITEVSYGNDVHRRVGAAVGVALVTLGIGAMLLLVKTKKHYVGVVWDNPNAVADSVAPPKGGVVFKVGKGEYRGFIAALEGLTGKKAVNADGAPGGTSK